MEKEPLPINIKGNPGEHNQFQFVEVHDRAILQMFPNVKSLPGANEPCRPLLITEIIKVLADPSRKTQRKRKFDTRLFDFTPKIQFNQLVRWAEYINRLKSYSAAVEKVYKEFDRQAMDTSNAVLDWLNDQYQDLHRQYEGDELFDEIQKRVYDCVHHDPKMDSAMPVEILHHHIRIVLVDAFMKCSIFKKPIM